MRGALRSTACAITFLCAALVAPAGRAEDLPPVSFRNEVMAVLSKSGCNAGACHGNKSGKGGFKLSLRGQDPASDYDVLTRDMSGRRTNSMEPDKSLVLLKPTMQLAHDGGLRFKPGSREHRILRNWIDQGTPPDSASTPTLVNLEVTPAERVMSDPEQSVQITAHAVFSDGSRRDVSALAVYEQSTVLAAISPDGLVRREKTGETTVIVRYLHLQQPVRLAFIPARPDFKWTGPPPANYIDEHVFTKLRSIRVNPSGACTDAEFLRRAYLDLLGILPTPDEVKMFLADASPERRARLTNALLQRSEFADAWALKWADLLKLEERTLDRKGAQAFHRWIRQSFAGNKPLDVFARELISARGSTYANPPANYYRANRDAVSRAETTAQVFLGTRLNCAQCHNHPFDRWTQEDYYSWAAVFGGVEYKVLQNLRRDNNDSHEFVGEQIVFHSGTGSVKDPRTGKPAQPRYLGNDTPSQGAADPLDTLAAWVTSADNPLFARAQVNRIWSQLMGRGIVDPIDDFRATNPPTHPELLDALTRDFIASGFDVRHVIRLIMASRTYALSATPDATNAEDFVNYSRAVPRRLTAEQLIDAQHQAMGVASRFNGYPQGTRAGELAGVAAVPSRRQRPSEGERFLSVFGKPPRLLACDCERSNEATMPQAFAMISGPEITRLISDGGNRLTRMLTQGSSTAEMIDELYLATLTRPPTSTEMQAMTAHVERARDRRRGLEDVAWALLNSKEFILRK